VPPPFGPPQLVTFLGSPRSGSTLLGHLLSNHSSIETLGNAFLGLPWPEGECSCGQPFVTCPYWSRVVERLPEGVADVRAVRLDRPRVGSGRVSLPALPEVLLGAGTKALLEFGARHLPRLDESLREARKAWAIFGAASEAFAAPVIVNAKLRPDTALALFRTRPEGSAFKLIYVLRDGRGSAYSIMRYRDLSMEQASRNWRRRTIGSLLTYARIPRADRMRVRYEDLCADPVAELSRICSFLGLGYEEGMEIFPTEPQHRFGGSPSPMLEGRVIRLDERWRSELTPADLESFRKQAGRVNNLLGYR
jgi:hypothetical protein